MMHLLLIGRVQHIVFDQFKKILKNQLDRFGYAVVLRKTMLLRIAVIWNSITQK